MTPENDAVLLETSITACPSCGFDMDLYESGGKEYLLCCNCEAVVIPGENHT